MNTDSRENPAPTVDVSRMYVRVKEVAADGNVRFDFAISWPELSVELVLPQSAFDEFCRHNHVQRMQEAEAAAQPFGEGEKA